LAEGDNELLINLKDKLSVEMFVSIIKKRPNIVLKEFLFDEKTAIVRDENGNAYTNEFIAILQKNIEASSQTEGQDVKQSHSDNVVSSSLEMTEYKTPRTFSLGSEWLYYKLYCGVKTGDTILTEVIKPLTEQLMEQQLIDSWFFIRYADPDIHLRLRFHFTDLKHIGTVIDLFQNAIAAYEKYGLIWKVQTDTYQREIERYGENAILLGEHIFHYDSKCIVDVLDMIDGDEGEEIRWLFAIRMVDALLVDFNYSEEQKRDLLEDLKTGFALEFNMNKDLKMQVDKKFRAYRQSIIDVLDTKNDATSELQPLFEVLNEKSMHIKPIVSQVLKLHKNNELPLSLNDLLASYIHMLLNRLFKNKQRLHEMVVYDLMWRTYRSEIAKQKSIKKQLAN
jgi:thiopeptide-type bacteriocin biosynthesis protein